MKPVLPVNFFLTRKKIYISKVLNCQYYFQSFSFLYIVGYNVSIYLVYQQLPETELASARPNVEIKAVKQLEDVPQGKLRIFDK